MQTFEADKVVSLSVPLTYNGQPAVPDAGTAVLSVLGPSGDTIYAENLTTGPADVVLWVTVPAEHNQIKSSFGRRSVKINATTGGIPFECVITYRLTPPILYTVRPADVRAFLGVNASELPDGEIDLAAAYLKLEFETSREIMTTALTSGEEAEMRANDAILYTAALAVIPSLANRVAQEESDGVLTFRRNTQKDFSDLKAAAEERLSAALTIINPTIDPGYAILITTTDTDPITGG